MSTDLEAQGKHNVFNWLLYGHKGVVHMMKDLIAEGKVVITEAEKVDIRATIATLNSFL